MPHMIIRHKVADFDAWKKVYLDHEAARQAAGLNVRHLWRNENDSNEVFILMEASDLEMAKELASSSELKEKMEASGVVGQPDIAFLLEDDG